MAIIKLGPHPATVVQRREAPHPATVAQPRLAPHSATVAQPRLAPHPATVVQPRLAPHPATVGGIAGPRMLPPLIAQRSSESESSSDSESDVPKFKRAKSPPKSTRTRDTKRDYSITLLEDNGNFEEPRFGGRPVNLLGAEYNHLSSWRLIQECVTSAVQNKPINDGIKNLETLGWFFAHMPLLLFTGDLLKNPASVFKEAKSAFNGAEDLLDKAKGLVGTSDSSAAAVCSVYCIRLLEHRSCMPFVNVDGHKSGGNTEGTWLGKLRDMENLVRGKKKITNTDKNDCIGWFIQLFDCKALEEALDQVGEDSPTIVVPCDMEEVDYDDLYSAICYTHAITCILAFPRLCAVIDGVGKKIIDKIRSTCNSKDYKTYREGHADILESAEGWARS